MNTPIFIGLLCLLIPAAVFDIYQRRIPNVLTLTAMGVGIVYWSYLGGLDGFFYGVGGLILGLGSLIVFYVMRVMGAGDVKLMGAVGSFLGPDGVFHAFLYIAIIGGLYAFLVLVKGRAVKQTAGRVGWIAMGFLGTGQFMPALPQECKLPPLCYGVAISLGTMLSVLRPLSF